MDNIIQQIQLDQTKAICKKAGNEEEQYVRLQKTQKQLSKQAIRTSPGEQQPMGFTSSQQSFCYYST